MSPFFTTTRVDGATFGLATTGLGLGFTVGRGVDRTTAGFAVGLGAVRTVEVVVRGLGIALSVVTVRTCAISDDEEVAVGNGVALRGGVSLEAIDELIVGLRRHFDGSSAQAST